MKNALMLKKRFGVIFLIASIIISCDDDNTVRDEIIIRVNGGASSFIKVHGVSGGDSFGECTVVFFRNATNTIEDYRQVAIRIEDCDVIKKKFPYQVQEFVLIYNDGNGLSFINRYHEDESFMTVTYFNEKVIKGNFNGKLYDTNVIPNAFAEVTGSFEIPVKF